MDDWTRIIIAGLIGLGLGLLLGYWLNDFFTWVVVGLAVSIATDTALRTIKNVNLPPNSVLTDVQKKEGSSSSINQPPDKPIEPKF